MEILIESTGKARCLYSDDIALSTLGQLKITRGSHVEPTSHSQWIADLSPVDGPTLGPFPTRTDALDAEQSWLNIHWLAPTQ